MVYKILISGSHHYTNYSRNLNFLKEFIATIISGGVKGAGTLAVKAATSYVKIIFCNMMSIGFEFNL